MPFRAPDQTAAESLADMPSFLGHYVADDDARGRLMAALAAAPVDPDGWADLLTMLSSMGREYGRQPTHPVARRLAEHYLDALVLPESTLDGIDHLDTPGPTLVVGNHLGYADTLALRQVLIRAGRQDLADRISAVAGPKVYQEPLRLFAVCSHDSIRVAQSSQITDGASAREMVQITKRCLTDCRTMLDEGLLLVLFAEGTRSRSGRLGPFIKAVSRWVTQPGLTVVPLGHWGSETLYALDGDRLAPAPFHGRFGPPIDVDQLKAEGRSRNDILEHVHRAVDALLPPEYRCEGPRLR